MSRVFAIGLVDRCSNPGRVIPKTQKMVLDAALLNTQHCKVWINPGNGVTPFLHLGVVAIEKEPFDYGRQLYKLTCANSHTHIQRDIYIYIYIYILSCTNITKANKKNLLYDQKKFLDDDSGLR